MSTTQQEPKAHHSLFLSLFLFAFISLNLGLSLSLSLKPTLTSSLNSMKGLMVQVTFFLSLVYYCLIVLDLNLFGFWI